MRFGSVRSGASGQFWVGVILGAVWSPCVGPTLGAASLLAAQSQDVIQVGTTMFAFRLRRSAPAACARPVVARGHDALAPPHCIGEPLREVRAKRGLSAVFVAIGMMVLTALDKSVETILVEASPQWFTDLTTRFCCGCVPVEWMAGAYVRRAGDCAAGSDRASLNILYRSANAKLPLPPSVAMAAARSICNVAGVVERLPIEQCYLRAQIDGRYRQSVQLIPSALVAACDCLPAHSSFP
jgi:hypothetical protein